MAGSELGADMRMYVAHRRSGWLGPSVVLGVMGSCLEVRPSGNESAKVSGNVLGW